MKLSIITINYNNLEGLRKTICSVVSQSWRDFEWIVVDGGSTDGSRELIEDYAAKGCFAWWCSEPDKGVYNAMNKGIRHAQGEYLNFMNSGDCFHSDNILKFVFSKDRLCDVLYGDVVYVESSGKRMLRAKNPLTLSHLYFSTIYHQSSFIKKTVFGSSGYDESLRIVSDWSKWLELVLENKTFEYLESPIADMDTTGISMTNFSLQKKEREMVLDKILPIPIKKDLEELISWREREAWNPELGLIYIFLSKRLIYKRLIRITIRIISTLDRFLK